MTLLKQKNDHKRISVFQLNYLHMTSLLFNEWTQGKLVIKEDLIKVWTCIHLKVCGKIENWCLMFTTLFPFWHSDDLFPRRMGKSFKLQMCKAEIAPNIYRINCNKKWLYKVQIYSTCLHFFFFICKKLKNHA